MYVEAPIAGVNVGEDKSIEITLYDLGALSLTTYPSGTLTDAELDRLVEAGTVSVEDNTGHEYEFTVRKTDVKGDPALILKTTGAGGVTRSAGKATVALVKADTWNGSEPVMKPGKYRYALMRTNSGAATIKRAGYFILGEKTSR